MIKEAIFYVIFLSVYAIFFYLDNKRDYYG